MDSFYKFGGWSAIITGILSILYAIFYLVIARSFEFIGNYGSWLILATSGLFTSAAYVALYRRVHTAGEGFALWGLLLGVGASLASLQHGVYEASLLRGLTVGGVSEHAFLATAQQIPSEVDPAGLAAFFIVGLVSFIFSGLILYSDALPRPLGYLGLLNAVLLVILYLASATDFRTLILISGGLTSILVGPVWWIWLGLALQRRPA